MLSAAKRSTRNSVLKIRGTHLHASKISSRHELWHRKNESTHRTDIASLHVLGLKWHDQSYICSRYFFELRMLPLLKNRHHLRCARPHSSKNEAIWIARASVPQKQESIETCALLLLRNRRHLSSTCCCCWKIGIIWAESA